MRGNPLDLDVLCEKISKVRWDSHLRAMEKGWMAIWKREWIFLYEGLRSCEDARASNIHRKLINSVRVDADGVEWVGITNKLYLTKSEQPWLIAWIEEQMLPTCDKCGKHTDKIFIWGDAGDEGFCRPCFQEVA
jgi:hypothetical protein